MNGPAQGWAKSILDDSVSGVAVRAGNGIDEQDFLKVTVVFGRRRQAESFQFLAGVVGDPIAAPGRIEDLFYFH